MVKVKHTVVLNVSNNMALRKKINNWKNGLDDGYETNGTVRRYIKRYLIEKNNHKCSECGWNKINPNTNKCPLEIHHIDGNYKNNNESNLQLS